MVIDLQDTVKQNAGKVWQYNSTNPSSWITIDIGSNAWQKIVNRALKTAKNIVKRKTKNANQAKQQRLNEAKVEETIWWYNYYLPWNNWEQGQVNALNWTGAVAWIPTQQIPTVNLDQTPWTETATPETTITPETTAPKAAHITTTSVTSTTSPTSTTSTTSTQQQTPETPMEETEQEPEVVEDIPDKPFGAEQPWQTWQIYGRELWTDSNWWDFAFGEETLADPYSIEAKMYNSRKNNYNALQSADSYSTAVLIVSWTTPYGEQAMYDLQMYNPEKYKQIQDYVKELRAWDTINAIASWKTTYWTSLAQITEDSIENDKTTFVNQNSTIRTADTVSQYLNNKLDANQTATTAKQQMMIYKNQIADLQAELEDLPNQAKKAFKGDVPDYFYKAYIANNSQRIQSEIDKLESKYTWLADIYKTELAQAQWETEMQFKYLQFQETKNQNAFDQWYKASQLELNSIQWSKDSAWNMFAYKMVNWQVVKVSDWTAYQNYTSTVNSIVSQATNMANQWNVVYWECEAFTDDMAQKAAWVRMVWTSSGWETTAAEKAWYATQFWTFSDYIPEVWDVAVFINNWTNWISEKRWHTMYVTWYDPNTNTVTLVWSNRGWDQTVYSKSYNLSEFYNKGWQWFRNPYKYAQWSSAIQNQVWITSWWYSPMQWLMDELIEKYSAAWKTNMLSNVWQFQEAYSILYNDLANWNLAALIDEGIIWQFLNNVALQYANSDASSTTWWRSKTSVQWALSKFLNTTSQEALQQASIYAAQHAWSEEAYQWFLTLMRLTEIKLRDESWAAINQWEWWTNFMQYMPQAWDTKSTINHKMQNLEQYVRRIATECWITSKQYIPLFENLWKRSID